MDKNILYVVMNEGEVEYVSTDKEEAETFVDNQMYEARNEVLNVWGNDDPTEKDIAEADFQAGFEADNYEVVKVDISNLTEDDMIELSDGTEIQVNKILGKLLMDHPNI